MTLFFVSLGVVIFALVLMMVFLSLWVYKDAQVRSEQSPGVWVLIALLVPNFLGVVIYLLIGRPKQVESPGTFKKAALAAAVFFGVSMAAFVGSSIWMAFGEMRGDMMGSVRSGSFTFMNETFRNQEWTVTARRANGFIRRSPVLSMGSLQNIIVDATVEEGDVVLFLTQGNVEHVIDITHGFWDIIDTSGFQPGPVRMTLFFTHARDVEIIISWRN